MSNRKRKVEALPLPVVGGKVGDLVKALRFAVVAASQEKTRTYPVGVRIDCDSRGVHIRATDGHRMHVTRFPGTWADGCASALALLKTDDVRAILKAFGTVKAQRAGTRYGPELAWRIDYATLKLEIGDKAWQCEAGSIDLDRVVPHEPETVFSCYGDQLQPFLIAASAACRGAFKITAQNNSDGESLKLEAFAYSDSKHGNNCRTDITSTIDRASVNQGLDREMGFNPRYVLDVINGFGPKNPMLIVRQHDSSSPAILSAGDKDQFVVLMPCRV